MDILKVKRSTLRHYIYRGYLDRVYGGGCRAIGVTRESLLRFMTHRTVEHRGGEGNSARHICRSIVAALGTGLRE